MCEGKKIRREENQKNAKIIYALNFLFQTFLCFPVVYNEHDLVKGRYILCSWLEGGCKPRDRGLVTKLIGR